MRPLRLPLAIVLGLFALLIAAPAWACGGLVNTNGSVTLVRTTTLAAYHRGIEHYVTSFEFAGGKGEFGSIIPLPGVPTRVIRGGDWTLQRLVQETQPPQPESFALATAAGAAEDRAKVILKTEIDALDIVVLEGGGSAVGDWAREHGFFLPPDAPEVLDFYAERSPIFMTVRFDASRAAEQGLGAGDGTPVHVVIPTTNPWVPLRILGLGAGAEAPVEADVYLLTDLEPATLPAPPSSRKSLGKLGVERRGDRIEVRGAEFAVDLDASSGRLVHWEAAGLARLVRPGVVVLGVVTVAYGLVLIGVLAGRA